MGGKDDCLETNLLGYPDMMWDVMAQISPKDMRKKRLGQFPPDIPVTQDEAKKKEGRWTL